MVLLIRFRARLAMADKNPDSQEAKLPVRRRLNFGDANDDDQSAKADLERQFEEARIRHLEEKKAKWNFDFAKGCPLEGPYEWEPVHPPSESRSNGTVTPASANVPADRPQGDAADQAH